MQSVLTNILIWLFCVISGTVREKTPICIRYLKAIALAAKSTIVPDSSDAEEDFGSCLLDLHIFLNLLTKISKSWPNITI